MFVYISTSFFNPGVIFLFGGWFSRDVRALPCGVFWFAAWSLLTLPFDRASAFRIESWASLIAGIIWPLATLSYSSPIT